MTMTEAVCLQCGTRARNKMSTFCGRCGLPYGAPPRSEGDLAACHICYQSTGEDGKFDSLDHRGLRVDLQRHLAEHDHHSVGDDDYLESLREGDRIRIGRWTASFDVVRRYLVTGAVDGGKRRAYEHNMIVTAMTQIRRFGTNPDIMGDQPEWQASREAVSVLMERYHRS
jgi:hypothetical protein